MDKERPIEKLLRDSARERSLKLGEPPQLHPVNRRHLQDEVRRVWAPSASSTPWYLSAVFWPRLAWSAAILVAVGLVVWMVVPPATEQNAGSLALSRESQPASPPPSPEALGVPMQEGGGRPERFLESRDQSTPMESLGRAKIEADSGTKAVASSVMPSTPSNYSYWGNAPAPSSRAFTEATLADSASLAPAASPAVPAASEPEAKVYSSKGTSFGALAVETQTPPAKAAANSQQWVVARSAADINRASNAVEQVSGRQNYGLFVRNDVRGQLAPVLGGTFETARRSVQAPQTHQAQILSKFSVEQHGAQIIVNDSDGSKYAGTFQLPSPSRDRSGSNLGYNLKKVPGVGLSDSLQSSQLQNALQFSVAGTNQTTRRLVRFTGNLIMNQALQSTQLNAVLPNNQSNASNQVTGEIAVDGEQFRIEAFQIQE